MFVVDGDEVEVRVCDRVKDGRLTDLTQKEATDDFAVLKFDLGGVGEDEGGERRGGREIEGGGANGDSGEKRIGKRGEIHR